MKLEEVGENITLWETSQLALYTKTDNNDDDDVGGGGGGGGGGVGDDGDDEFKD